MVVSVLFNEPKLLKFGVGGALGEHPHRVSVLFNEPKLLKSDARSAVLAFASGFSALQRAEIAEMLVLLPSALPDDVVSVLFNEPKLLKSVSLTSQFLIRETFQCSSTSRNC